MGVIQVTFVEQCLFLCLRVRNFCVAVNLFYYCVCQRNLHHQREQLKMASILLESLDIR